MLEINDLSVSFRRYKSLFRQEQITRLSGFNLNLAAGEVLAVIGHSGGGKSLLAHAILGLLPENAITGGQMRFDGQPLDETALRKIRGKQIALLPQQISHLDPTAHVGAQIRWAARRAGSRPLVDERLAAVGLNKDTGKLYPHQLSGGMARRVMMSQAVAGGAKLIVADEPTAGLDPENRDIVLDRLRQHADDGGAVLLITHDLIPVLSRADRVAILSEGKMCCLAPTSAFIGTGEALLSAYAKAIWRALPQNGFSAYA